jgi:hypothetical protein
VLGDPKDFRRWLDRRIARGRELLERLDAADPEVRAEVEGLQASDSELGRSLLMGRFLIASHVQAIDRWDVDNFRGMARYLGRQADSGYGLPSLGDASGADPLTCLGELRTRLIELIVQLDHVRRRTPQSRNLPRSPNTRLDELRSSGLLSSDVLADFERRLGPITDRRKWRSVIAAAKELVESVNRGALIALGKPSPPGSTKFAALGKVTLRAVAEREATASRTPFDENRGLRLGSALISTLDSLGSLRNQHGEGHGRATFPKGLAERHVRLAADSAIAYSRFLVLSLNDLGLLGGSEFLDVAGVEDGDV